MSNNDLLIFIPTYNEKENIKHILRKIIDLNLQAEILFIDDNSPDGTGIELDKLAIEYTNISVIHRRNKMGIGSAHYDAINFAYDKGFRRLITMDCDFSHSPEYIFDFLSNSEKADIVVGSRFLQDKSLVEWNMLRKSLTHLGHIATRNFLKMPYDATGFFRLYHLDKISRDFLTKCHSHSYSFSFESLYILHLNNYNIVEIPINLPSRVYGNSKMNIYDASYSLYLLLKLYITSKILFRKFMIKEPINKKIEGINYNEDWNKYWTNKKNEPVLYIYDLIASFYRNYIIKPNLNNFIFKRFKKGDKLLHAGCGGGQVDIEISEKFKISALDISEIALEKYKINNPNAEKLVQADIFSIPVKDSTYHGLYNLGVMEHFKEDEIVKIMSEFKRVVRPNGKIVLFWPHEFGPHVLFLKFIHFIIIKIFRSKIRLHPPEITRIKSRKHINDICKEADIHMDSYSFTIRDIFTYVVITLSNKSLS